MKKIALAMTAVLIFVTSVSAVTLFEIKDELGNPVLVVSSDGLRILNGTDTLMVISTEGIKAFIETDPAKGKARTFSVSSGTNSGDVLNVTKDGMRIYDQTDDSKALGDTLMTISSRSIKAHISGGSKALSRTFSVTTASSKGQTNVLDVNTSSTTMREAAGSEYTKFSPENIFLGLNSGSLNTLGLGNTFMGNNAGMSNSSGNSNVFIGEAAGKYYNSSYGNVFIGQSAAENLYAGQRNVMIGYSAGSSPLSTFNSYGNVFIGGVAGSKVSGNYNVMVGEGAGENYQASGSTGGANVFMGKNAGQHATGSGNVVMGFEAFQGAFDNVNPGNYNIIIGPYSGKHEKGSYKMSIGSDYGPLLYGRLNNTKMLVVDGVESDNTQSRKFFVKGTAGGTTVWYNDSDERLKKNIRTVDGALDKVMRLRGVTYEWKDTEKHEKGRKMGFIAQEAVGIIPEVVDRNEENDHYSMQYSSITALLVEAVKELKDEISKKFASAEIKNSESRSIIDAQNEKIDILIRENKELKNKVEELEGLRAEIEQIKLHIANYSSR
jgi:hypothetical protein